MNTDLRRRSLRGFLLMHGVMQYEFYNYASILLTAGLVWGGDDLIGLWAFLVAGSLLSLFVLMKGLNAPKRDGGA